MGKVWHNCTYLAFTCTPLPLSDPCCLLESHAAHHLLCSQLFTANSSQHFPISLKLKEDPEKLIDNPSTISGLVNYALMHLGMYNRLPGLVLLDLVRLILPVLFRMELHAAVLLQEW